MLTGIKCIFWASVALIGYSYAGYPVLIYLLSRAFGRRAAATDIADAELPSVSVLIAVHNEEAVIEQRIENALQLDYPADRLDVVIASDGSDDRTVALAGKYGRRVQVLNYSERRGKAATLTAAAQVATGQILLLSDANTSIDPTALRRLVRWFTNPSIGVVCGRLILTDPTGSENVDGSYWRYETFLKCCESRLGALLGANGAIYAIRRDSVGNVPAGTVVDDFVIPLLAKLRRNYSIVYDGDAVGREETPASMREEFRRRVRIGTGGYQALGMLWPLLDPRRGWISLAFLSHKILRWLCPLLMLATLIGAAVLLRSDTLYLAAFFAQIGFYSLCAVIWKVARRIQLPRPIRLAGMFAAMNAALLLGLVRWAMGKPQGVWQRTERMAGRLPQAA